MALTFPLSCPSFFQLLPIKEITFDCPEVLATTRTKGGEILTADNGERLWQGEITLGQITRAELSRVRPLINLLRGMGSFLIFDPIRPFPQADANGALLSGFVPTISALVSNRELSITGLPPGYKLCRDDMLSFRYAANPTRYALHEVVSDATASAGGNITAMEVNPPIRAGATVGTAVTLTRPICKAMIVPDSHRAGRSNAHLTEGTSFQFCQTLR